MKHIYNILALVFIFNICKGQEVEWSLFNTFNSDIPFNKIGDIEIDNKNNLWISSWYISDANGLCKYDGKTWTHYNTDNSELPTNHLICIETDNNNVKWIGSWRSGVIRFDGEEFATYSVENSSLPDNEINCIAVDHLNNIWIGSDNNISVFNHESWTTYNYKNSNVPNSIIKSIAVDKNNYIWFSTENGLVEYNGIDWIIHTSAFPELYSGHYGNWFGSNNSLVIKDDNTKFMSGGRGVMSFNDKQWEYYDYLKGDRSCLISCSASCLTIYNNDIWVGFIPECSYTGGLLNYSKCEKYYLSQINVHDNDIVAIEGTNNGIWIGSHNGLLKLEVTYDTCNIQIFDTIDVEVYDTIYTELFDTTFVEIYDTIITSVFDTIYTTFTDTSYISVTDTLIIYVPLSDLNGHHTKNTIKIYPNPASDYITIDYGSFEKMNDYKLEIVNNTGATVFREKTNKETSNIDLRKLSTGIYHIYIKNETNVILVEKILILK